MGRSYAWLVAVALAGCGTSEGAFLDDYTRVLCDRARECDPEAFDEFYENEAECRDDLGDLFAEDAFDDCEFDRGAANDCLAAARKAPCDDLEGDDEEAAEACGRVYDCPEG